MGPLKSAYEWDLIEFFAGDARISRLAAKTGFRVATCEINLGKIPRNKINKRKTGRSSVRRNPMDFNGECGYACFASSLSSFFYLVFFLKVCCNLAVGSVGPSSLPSVISHSSCQSLRLAVALLLQNAFQGLVVMMGPPCSTWIAINAGTSKRTILCPAGDQTLLQNRKSNKIACRQLGCNKNLFV